MSGLRVWQSRGSGRGRLQALLAAAGSFLLDPPEGIEPRVPAAGPASADAPAEPTPDARLTRTTRPVVAVFGLAGGCGSTMVARAVAAELAARDASGTAAVACESRPGGLPLASKAAARLARALEDLPGGARAHGRLCLLRGADPGALGDALRGLAPLVIDAGSSSLGGVPACIADRTLVVTTPALEPTLARVAIDCVGRVGPEPTLVLNRARHAEDGSAGTDEPLVLPESRLGAQLALSGREPRGALGRAIGGLVEGWDGGG